VDAGADLGEDDVLGGLEHDSFDPLASQRNRRRQTADAAACDDRAHVQPNLTPCMRARHKDRAG
jgi:hypothetical protein